MRWLVPIVVFALAGTAHAIPRGDCPAGTSWNIAAGACVKKKAAPRMSPQEKFDRASDDIEGRGKAPDPKRGLKTLEDTCVGDSHAASCRLLGFLYVRGRAPVAKDDSKAADYFAKACGFKDLEACVDVGDLGVRTGDYAKARIAFQHGCDLGNGVACVRDADLLERGLGGTKDEATALPLYKRSLDKLTPLCPATGSADGGACSQVGWMHENGKGTSKSLDKALAAFRTGCNVGHGEACMGLGRALDAGYGGAADTDGANKAYDKACTDFDNADACQKIGERLGMAKQDLPRAFKFSERGCQLDPKYCGTLAEFYRLGFGLGAKDQVKATANYKKACDNGGLGWCQNFGERAHDGIGMAKDVDAGIAALEKACLGRFFHACGIGARFLIDKSEETRAAKLATQGCDDDDGDACYRVAWLTESGKGGLEKSPEKAVPFYEKACKLDSPIGCNGLANMHKAGAGTPKDEAKAVELYKKACMGNANELFTESCKSWGTMAHDGTGIPKDGKTAVTAMLRACEYQLAETCRLAFVYNFEIGGKRDDVLPTLDKACKADNDEACLAIGDVYSQGDSESDRRAGYQAFEAACAKKSASGCMRQADQLANGRGIAKNLEKAEQLYKSQCEEGYNYACNGLGTMWLLNKKPGLATPYFKRACENKLAEACNGIGFQYYTAAGVTWDITQAVKFFTQACELGSLSGCANTAELYRYGSGTPLDHKKAFGLYEKSCVIPTSNNGCHGYGHYLATGEGGAKIDKAMAEKVFRFACDDEFHHPEACQGLADLLEEQHKGSAAEIARLRTLAFSRATELSKDNPSYMYLLGTYYRDGVATMKDPVKALDAFSKGCDGFDPLGCVAAGKSLSLTGKKDDAERARVYFERACAAGVNDACTGKAKGPSAVGGKQGCCSGAVAPGAEGGAIVLMFVFARRRRRGLSSLGSRATRA